MELLDRKRMGMVYRWIGTRLGRAELIDKGAWCWTRERWMGWMRNTVALDRDTVRGAAGWERGGLVALLVGRAELIETRCVVLLDGKGAALDADGREVDGWEHGGGAGGESGWSWYSWWIGIEISSGWHRRCDNGNGAAGEQGHAKLLGPGILVSCWAAPH